MLWSASTRRWWPGELRASSSCCHLPVGCRGASVVTPPQVLWLRFGRPRVPGGVPGPGPGQRQRQGLLPAEPAGRGAGPRHRHRHDPGPGRVWGQLLGLLCPLSVSPPPHVRSLPPPRWRWRGSTSRITWRSLATESPTWTSSRATWRSWVMPGWLMRATILSCRYPAGGCTHIPPGFLLQPRVRKGKKPRRIWAGTWECGDCPFCG